MASHRVQNPNNPYLPEEARVDLHPAISVIDSNQLEWVIGGNTTNIALVNTTNFITPDEGGSD